MGLQNQIGALASLYNEGGLKSRLRRWWNFAGTSHFENRSNNAKGLVIILAGYKPRLWPLVFPRFKRFLPADWDVCIVVAGKKDAKLNSLAKDFGWSVLRTSANKVGLAQNHAIRNHPAAELICKLDEDIFIAHGFLEGLEETLHKTEEEGIHCPGFVAPVLNVNGFSSRIFLETMGLLFKFEGKFGRATQRCMETPAWSNADAAAYLWQIMTPFDGVAERFMENPYAVDICHHRFSIGAILYRREVWEAMGGISVSGSGILGGDEADLCSWCVEHSRAMVISRRVLVGHAGFQSQLESLLPLLESRSDLSIAPCPPTPAS